MSQTRNDMLARIRRRIGTNRRLTNAAVAFERRYMAELAQMHDEMPPAVFYAAMAELEPHERDQLDAWKTSLPGASELETLGKCIDALDTSFLRTWAMGVEIRRHLCEVRSMMLDAHEYLEAGLSYDSAKLLREAVDQLDEMLARKPRDSEQRAKRVLTDNQQARSTVITCRDNATMVLKAIMPAARTEQGW